jgi:predicted metal-dependent hydrolase
VLSQLHPVRAHEVLEGLWLAERGPVRELYQGVLQIAVALLHRQRGNYQGAVSLLQSGLRHLAPFGPLCRQLDVDRLQRETAELLVHLQELGPQRLTEMEVRRVPKLRLVSDSVCNDELGGDDGDNKP